MTYWSKALQLRQQYSWRDFFTFVVLLKSFAPKQTGKKKLLLFEFFTFCSLKIQLAKINAAVNQKKKNFYRSSCVQHDVLAVQIRKKDTALCNGTCLPQIVVLSPHPSSTSLLLLKYDWSSKLSPKFSTWSHSLSQSSDWKKHSSVKIGIFHVGKSLSCCSKNVSILCSGSILKVNQLSYIVILSLGWTKARRWVNSFPMASCQEGNWHAFCRHAVHAYMCCRVAAYIV